MLVVAAEAHVGLLLVRPLHAVRRRSARRPRAVFRDGEVDRRTVPLLHEVALLHLELDGRTTPIREGRACHDLWHLYLSPAHAHAGRQRQHGADRCDSSRRHNVLLVYLKMIRMPVMFTSICPPCGGGIMITQIQGHMQCSCIPHVRGIVISQSDIIMARMECGIIT